MTTKQMDPLLESMDKRIREQAQELIQLRDELDTAKRDAMNWKTTVEALAQQRDRLQAEYRGMSHAVRIMTEVFARID